MTFRCSPPVVVVVVLVVPLPNEMIVDCASGCVLVGDCDC
jgi:hypothetical protein